MSVVGVVLAVAAAFLFQPWKLWIDEVVNEELPQVTQGGGAPSRGQDGHTGSVDALRVLATGQFISHEHATSGTVRVVGLPDGSRVLRLENLDTSNGPALHVWLSNAPVLRGREGWFVFDDGRHVDLGPLKGNVGNQNYPVPAAVDLGELSSVSIWCERFRVSFGAAELG